MNFIEFVRKESSKEKSSNAFASKIDDILSSDSQKKTLEGSDLASSEIDSEIFGKMEETPRSEQEICEKNDSSVYGEKKCHKL